MVKVTLVAVWGCRERMGLQGEQQGTIYHEGIAGFQDRLHSIEVRQPKVQDPVAVTQDLAPILGNWEAPPILGKREAPLGSGSLTAGRAV